jgi:hypothetical protein
LETGLLSEIFRTRYAIARSIYPTHSRHRFDVTPVSANSPYGLLGLDLLDLVDAQNLLECVAGHTFELKKTESILMSTKNLAKSSCRVSPFVLNATGVPRAFISVMRESRG